MDKCLHKRQLEDAVGVSICMDCGEVIIPDKFKEPEQALNKTGSDTTHLQYTLLLAGYRKSYHPNHKMND